MMTTDPARSPGASIHRLLDEAFAGIDLTPDVQDLKEEMRANLVARAAELEASGVLPGVAARRAIDELGDVRALVEAEFVAEAGAAGAAGAPGATGAADPGGLRSRTESAAMLHQLNRVRPRPAFVLRVVLAAVIAAAGLGFVALAATGVVDAPIGLTLTALGIAAIGVGWIVGDALGQETTTNHPMPRSRAGGYGWAALITVFGLGLAGIVVLGALPLGIIAVAALCVVLGVALFAYLGVTQTNRHKAWVRAVQHAQPDLPNAFDDDPAVAARFGIYTVVLWTVGVAVFLVLSFTVGWAWSWIALVATFALWFVLLARMLFPSKR